MKDDVLSGPLASALASRMARREEPAREAHKFKVHSVAADGKTCTIEVGGKTVTADTGVTVAPADIVQATWRDGRFTVMSNLTNPAVVSDDEYSAVKDVAAEANVLLGKITDAADEAETTVSAIMDGMVAAKGSADAAAASARLAKDAADEARGKAEEVNGLATQAASDAEAAKTSASDALAEAADARQSAMEANASAVNALRGLSTVEDVVGTLNWIAEHGTFAATSDTSANSSKHYYSRSGSGTPADPYRYGYVHQADGMDPAALGLFEWTGGLDETVQNYIASHLALTDEGLWVTKDGKGCHLLVANDRLVFVGSDGAEVAYIAVDGNNESTFYMTRSVVVKDLKFGKWMWFGRANGNMALKWVG